MAVSNAFVMSCLQLTPIRNSMITSILLTDVGGEGVPMRESIRNPTVNAKTGGRLEAGL